MSQPPARGCPRGAPGTIAGYRLDGYVGQGSRAVVYLAQDGGCARRVAVKVMTPDLARDTGVRTRMIRESRAAAALGHPYIVPVFQADEADGTLYVAMRYERGGDARSLLAGWPASARLCLADRRPARIGARCRARDGLIHRDVRPANILLDSDDAGHRAARGHVYLSDFGMSQVFPPGQVIAADQAAGTLDYLAPEQIEGRDLDGRADQYSLACTGYELLCGAPPFGPDQGQTLMYAQIYADPPAASARRAGIPAAVDSVLTTALAKDPAHRHPSCGRFAEELRAALGLRPGEPADHRGHPRRAAWPPHHAPGRSRRKARLGRGPVAWPPAAPDAGRPAPATGQPGRRPARPHPPRMSRTQRDGPAYRTRPAGPRHRRGFGRPRSRAAARRIRTRGPVLAAVRRRRGDRRGRIWCRLVGAIGSRPPGRIIPRAGRLVPSPVRVAVAVIAVSGLFAVGAGPASSRRPPSGRC